MRERLKSRIPAFLAAASGGVVALTRSRLAPLLQEGTEGAEDAEDAEGREVAVAFIAVIPAKAGIQGFSRENARSLGFPLSGLRRAAA